MRTESTAVVTSSQGGIFALGTPSHAYFELDLAQGGNGRELVTAILSLREPRTTMGGVNLVAGFRPELWREVAPDHAPRELVGFNQPVSGSDGFEMPATQHDAVLWLSSASYDVIFDAARDALASLNNLAILADETSSWPYRHDRDLTGFIDGSENPTLAEAPGMVLIPQGEPGAGGCVLLLQKWTHDAPAWDSLTTERQEQTIGRTKLESDELDPKPADSHVARTDQDEFGTIFRRNMPFGSVRDHGTMFVGFSRTQAPLRRMLESMAGALDGTRDALTRYTKPLTGAYYFIPAAESLLKLPDKLP
jgi:putative iron-dependent peroxidase